MFENSVQWTERDIPDQTGRVILITGGNTGLGFETGLQLASHGGNVILACRNASKGEVAMRQINDTAKAGGSNGIASLEILDLSDIDDVKQFAARFLASHKRLDILILNAGVMKPPMSRTKQGHELQFGTNHLGHAALAMLLLPLLRETEGSRIVSLSSLYHKLGKIDFEDLDWKKRNYSRDFSYAQSKLANLSFALELQRRLSSAGVSSPIVVSAHPGWAATELMRTQLFTRLLGHFFAQSAARGALPTLRAATDEKVMGGSYWGPCGCWELRGYPVEVSPSALARNEEVSGRLYTVTESLLGLKFDL